MNAVDFAKRAYGANATPIRTPRNTEYAIFARISQRIRAAAQDPDNYNELSHALYDNKRLWRALAVDVASDDNALPMALRARIFALSDFVVQYSRKVLKGEASVDPLIDINAAIMRGLSEEGRAR